MDSRLNITRKVLKETNEVLEICFQIENPSEEEIWLKEAKLYHANSLKELGVTKENCLFFRSGRHKNDMPSVAMFGRYDDCMKDAIGAMSETGDRKADDESIRTVVSDHLTIVGNENGYCILAFMTGRDQMFRTEIAVDEEAEFVSLSSFAEFGIYLRPGEKVETEVLRIEHTKDAISAINQFALDKAKRYGSRNAENPSVFCTWYYYGLTVSYEDVLTNLNRMKELKLPFDVFQIDEGWEQTLGEWEPNEKFPIPMKEVAEQIKEAGYRPGIWTSPFVAKETASVWQKHPEWILKDMQGTPYLFPMNDTTYYVFDITNPATWDYFTELYRKLTFDWGYTYHKLDFTRAAVIYEDGDFYDKHITLAQAYYRAVAAIRKGMGEEAYFLMCGGLYDPIIGLVDAQRTGSDVLSMWSSTINKNGKTAPYTIKQSLMRYYMNAWWNNDPDALMVRRNEVMERGLRLTYGLLNDEEVKTSTVNQFIGGGIVCSTEPLDKISDDRLYQIRHILPVMKTKVQPLDFLSGNRFPSVVKAEFEKDERICVAIINWEDEEKKQVNLTLSKEILGTAYEENVSYVVSDFYSGEYALHVKAGECVSFRALEPHGATVIKIEKITDRPIVVASDGHYSMGLEIDTLETEEGKLIIDYEHKFDYPVTFKIWMGGEADNVSEIRYTETANK